MASAQSIESGQFSIKCQLCESETKIQWKCLDCDLLMCETCKEKIHPKFKKASQHKILPTKDVGRNFKESQRDFSEIICKEHNTQACVMFCKPCDQLVCPTCIARVHKKHDLLVIEEAFEIKLNNLEITKVLIEDDHESLTKDLKALDEMKAVELSTVDQTIQYILLQKQHFNDEADKYARNFMQQVDDQWKITEQFIDIERNRICELQQKLKEKASKIDTIKNQDTETFINEAITIEKFKVDMEPVIFPECGREEFLPGEITQNNFGLLQNSMNLKENLTDCKLSAVKEINTKLKIITGIVLVSDIVMWIFDHHSSKIQKIKVEGNQIKILESYDEDVYGMALTMQNELIISVNNGKIKILGAGQSRFASFEYEVEPFFAKAIHVTKTNNIIFGACKTENNLYITGGGIVIVKDMQGNEKAFYEIDKYGKALFTVPKSITSTKREIIAVVDKISINDHGRIVILDNSNTSFYKGHPDINSKNHQFKPEAVQATRADNLVVSDKYNNTLHILDCFGNLLAYHNTMEAGITGPTSLGFIKPGNFYIGCSTPKMSSDKAKIYEVVMPEC